MVLPNNRPMKASGRWAERRMDKAVSAFGAETPERILAFAWYLQGVETRDIAQYLGLPAGTLNGFFKRLFRDGLPALEDRRGRASAFLPTPTAQETEPAAMVNAGAGEIEVGIVSARLHLDRNDPLQCRTVLLALLESGCLDADAAADALGVSMERLRKLRAAFRRGGAGALADRRQGQACDYSMPPETKAELIRHYVENTEAGESVSAPALKAAIEASGKSCPSPQTLRVHIGKLGLDRIRADQRHRLKKGLRTV